MTSRLRITSLVALLVVGAGCGGNDERLTQAELVRQADAICAESNEKFAEAERTHPVTADPTSPEATEADLKRFGQSVPRQLEIARAQIAELRDLQPPETVEDEWNGALDDLERGFQSFEDAGTAARDLERERVGPELQEAVARFDEANAVSKRLGFRVCGARA